MLFQVSYLYIESFHNSSNSLALRETNFFTENVTAAVSKKAATAGKSTRPSSKSTAKKVVTKTEESEQEQSDKIDDNGQDADVEDCEDDAMEGVENDDGKPPSLTPATSVALKTLAKANETQYHIINGLAFPYTAQDKIDAELREMSLDHWILWKFENGIVRKVDSEET